VGQGELAEAGARLARLQQRPELAVRQVMRDALALEDPDRDRVGAGRGGRLDGCSDVHSVRGY
jgi:hypothetical protein